MKEKDGMIFISWLMKIDTFKEYWNSQKRETQIKMIDNLTTTAHYYLEEYKKLNIQ